MSFVRPCSVPWFHLQKSLSQTRDIHTKAPTPLILRHTQTLIICYHLQQNDAYSSEPQLAPDNVNVCSWVPKEYLFLGKGSSLPHVRDWQTTSRKQHRDLKAFTLSSLCKEAAACSCFSPLAITRLFPLHAWLPVQPFFLTLFQSSLDVPAKYYSLFSPRSSATSFSPPLSTYKAASGFSGDSIARHAHFGITSGVIQESVSFFMCWNIISSSYFWPYITI